MCLGSGTRRNHGSESTRVRRGVSHRRSRIVYWGCVPFPQCAPGGATAHTHTCREASPVQHVRSDTRYLRPRQCAQVQCPDIIEKRVLALSCCDDEAVTSDIDTCNHAESCRWPGVGCDVLPLRRVDMKQPRVIQQSIVSLSCEQQGRSHQGHAVKPPAVDQHTWHARSSAVRTTEDDNAASHTARDTSNKQSRYNEGANTDGRTECQSTGHRQQQEQRNWEAVSNERTRQSLSQTAVGAVAPSPAHAQAPTEEGHLQTNEGRHRPPRWPTTAP